MYFPKPVTPKTPPVAALITPNSIANLGAWPIAVPENSANVSLKLSSCSDVSFILFDEATFSIIASISELVGPNAFSTCSGEEKDSATDVPNAPQNPVLFIVLGSMLAKYPTSKAFFSAKWFKYLSARSLMTSES